MKNRTSGRGHIAVGIILVTWIVLCGPLHAQELLRTDFATEADLRGWSERNQAFVSDVGRRKGARSLLIKQWQDEEQDTHWRSPAIKNPGKPVKVSFWAADNYLKQPDFSYAAAVDIVEYDKAGKEIGTTMFLKSIPWDDSRKESMWGMFLPEGFVWRYYEAIHRPKGEAFRVNFHWGKALTRGECYLTDLLVTVAGAGAPSPAADTRAEDAGPKSRFALEVSTPAIVNTFYPDDPLRFEILLYTTDNAEIGTLKKAMVRYEITDYERLFVSGGEVAFDRAKPIADPKFHGRRYTKKMKFNLHQPLVVAAPAAKAVGRELFFQAELISDGAVLAQDTAPYLVLDPFRPDPKDYHKCRFSSGKFHHSFRYAESKHPRQSVADKTGISWNQIYDYGWKRVQPKYPGPYKFGDKRPAFPRITYCPNLEQIRGRKDDHPWGSNATLCPKEATMPDPLRPGRTTFKIDPYVEYIVAYIRHHREAIARVVPSGLERPIDARTIELHRKAYQAIRAEWPDLPVGIMLYGLTMNPSKDVDLFIENKFHECTDFIDTHVYASSVDWTEWDRLQAFYRRKLKREPPPLISTEFCRVGGMDQVQRSRDAVAAHLDAFAHGMFSIYYFNVTNTRGPMAKPFLRGSTDMGGDQTSGFMYMQWVQRLMTSEAIEPTNKHTARGRWDMYGCSYHPLLITAAYANLVRNFETADYRAMFHPSPNTIAYVFDRGQQTICAMWLRKPVPVETFVIRGDTPCTLQDLFGRTEQMRPVGGASLVSVGENPITLVFDGRVLYAPRTRKSDIEKAEGGLTLPPIARGGTGEARITLPGVFGSAFKATVASGVDATWPEVPKRTADVKPGAAVSLALPISVEEGRPVGAYPFTARLEADGKVFGLLRAPLQVEELLKLTVTGVPMTVRQDPAIEVAILSLRDQPSKGIVRLDSIFFADGFRPAPREQAVAVATRGTTIVRFPVAREQVNLTTTYEVKVDVEDEGGAALSSAQEIAFRATPEAPDKITIDGDLSDWNLKQQMAIPFSREFASWGKKRSGPDDLSGMFYSLWDPEHLYLAAVVKDDSHVSRYNDISMWADDNFMLGLYPWGWQKGDKLNSGFYREHVGMCKDGQARIFRVGNVAVGPATAEGAPIAVKREGTTTIYEWAYPKACVAPLALESGGRFRLSLFLLDTDEAGGADDGKPKYSRLGGIQIGGFNENVDARPVKWREFVLTGQ